MTGVCPSTPNRAQRIGPVKSHRPIVAPGRCCRVLATILLLLLFGVQPALAFDPLPPPPPANVPPLIDDFRCWDTPGGWSFSGQVLDEAPGGLTVTFGGVLNGLTATTDASGHFTLVDVAVSRPGIASAHTVDNQQEGSNYATCYIQ